MCPLMNPKFFFITKFQIRISLNTLCYRNDDIVLVDSPGIDVDADFDAWIDDECADADLFILVLNSESTLMMREKSFFHAVARKIAKPNILVLFNRWDCSDGEADIENVKVSF